VWSRTDLVELANHKLRALVRHCHARMPAIRELMQKHGLSPDDIRTVDDLPVSLDDQGLLAGRVPAGILDPHLSRRDRFVHRTGGSTGEPMFFYLSRRARATDRAGFYRHLRWVGSERGERMFSVWGDLVVASASAGWHAP